MTLTFSAPVLLRQPPLIHFGAGVATSAITSLAETDARRIFVVTSPSGKLAAEKLAAGLQQRGATVTLVADIPPEPTTARCERLRTEARAFAPDLVVGLGGGSVLDLAKLVAALHARPEPTAKFYGLGLVPARTTRLVCVPTTAGTGSEVSPNALLYDEAERAKKAVIGPSLVPDIAIVDPELMLSLPPALTATTGIDALSHCLEAYANRAAHPAVDVHALEGVRLIGGHLERAVTHGQDLAARSAVALGSLYGGLCLGPVNTAAVHALAYPLGGEFHLAHGVSIALLLAQVVEFNLSAAPERYAALARALGAAAANELPARLTRLLTAVNIPLGLARHGIPRDAIPRLADSALTVTRLLKNNPREITRDDAIRIYEAAF